MGGPCRIRSSASGLPVGGHKAARGGHAVDLGLPGPDPVEGLELGQAGFHRLGQPAGDLLERGAAEPQAFRVRIGSRLQAEDDGRRVLVDRMQGHAEISVPAA